MQHTRGPLSALIRCSTTRICNQNGYIKQKTKTHMPAIRVSDVKAEASTEAQPQIGETPLVRRQPVAVECCKYSYEESKAGNSQIKVTFEITQPQTIKAIDPSTKEKKDYSIAGQKLDLYLQWKSDKGLAQLNEFLNKIGADPGSVTIDDAAEDVNTLSWLREVAFTVHVTSETSKRMVHDAEKGEPVEERGPDGKPVFTNPRWKLLEVREIIGAVPRTKPF